MQSDKIDLLVRKIVRGLKWNSYRAGSVLLYTRYQFSKSCFWVRIAFLYRKNRKTRDILIGRTADMAEKEKYLQYGKLKINLLSRVACIDDQEIVLTRMEFDVLCFLTSNPDIAFTREQIYEAVSKEHYNGGSYIIRDIVYRLRTKLQTYNIQTLHGYGYKFIPDN